MLGNGDVSITGGAITLPPLKVAGMSFGGFTGGFSTQMVNVGGQQVKAYKFVGGAKLSMPGLEPSADKSISVAATVISIPSTNEIDEVDTQLTFEAHPGIPIASSGVELTKFTGGVHFKTGAITFTLGIGVDSTARIPPTGAGIPIVSMTGNALVRPDPFSMSLGAQLKILIFNVASAQMQVGAGAGFNACPPGTPANTPASQRPRGKGFYAEFNVDALFLHGNAKIRVGKVNGVRKFAGLATLNFGLEKGQFGFGLPRKTRTLAGITFAAGEFNVPGTSVNTTGMKGTFEIVGFDYSLFVNFNATLGSGNFVAMGHSLDDYQLVNGGAVLAATEKGVPGYAMKTTFGPDAADAPRVSVQVPLVVAHDADVYFGIHYTGTAPITPVIALTRVCGPRCVAVITATDHNSTTIFYDEDFSPVITQGNDIGFVIKNAPATTWTMHLDNVPADYAIVFYVGNNKPELAHVKTGSVTSGTQLIQSALTMILTDTDSPTATLTYGYGRVDTATNTLVEGAVTPIFTTTAQGTVTYTSVLSGQVPSGVYRWVATADDGKNAPVTYYDTRNLTITDNLPPAAPAGLAVLPLPRSIQLFWDPNTKKDLAGYEIGFGPAISPATFVYTRDMGAKEVSPVALAMGKSVAMRNSADGVASVTQFDGQLWGISDGTTISVGVRAYDESRNYSAWTIVSASPWSLSPEAVSPAPDFFGDVTTIQASFSMPLKNSGLAGYFEVRDDSNAVVSGTVSLLYGYNDGDVVGMRFIPNAPMLAGVYVATLMGGEDGINTPAGGYMPASYVWSWKQTNTVQPLSKVFIPMVRQ